MTNADRKSVAGISSMLAGLAIRGNASLTIYVEQDEVAHVRDQVTDILGQPQDRIIESDDRDTYVWQLDATGQRGWIVVYMVWMREGRAQRPTGEVIDFGAAKLLRDLKASLEPCPVCPKSRGTHTRAERAVCDALANTQPQPPTAG